MKGRIHSIETMGLLDGPGIRTVVFLQGCPLRCQYCHNPDSQRVNGGKEMDSEEILEIVKRFKPYFKRSKGGVTISGGEPLIQGDFLIELLQKIQGEGICTVVDTSGFGDKSKYDEILKYTDLVLLDLKHYDPKEHMKLVKRPMNLQEDFIESLIKNNTRLWIRHVMVPGWTDNEESMRRLAERILPLYDRVEKIEILPYMTFGEGKYKELGLEYELEGVDPMKKSRAKELEEYLIDYLEEQMNIKRVV